MKKVVLITGISSGFGLEIGKKFIKFGYEVYGIGKENFSFPGINYFKVDVTDEVQYLNILKLIEKNLTRLDVLINNVGYGISGASESTSISDIKKQFSVNFFSNVLTTNFFLPLLRKTDKSKIAFISSAASYFPIPFQSFYSASKAALTSYAKALAIELKPFKIRVSVFEPGDAKTNFTKNRTIQNEKDEYKTIAKKSIKKMADDERKGLSAKYVAQKICKKLLKKNPPLVYVVGFKYRVFVFLKRIFSQRFINFLMYILYGR